MMRRNNPQQGARVLEALQRRAEFLGARRDPSIDAYFTMLEYDPSNQTVAELIESKLSEYEEQQRVAPNWLPRPPEAAELYSDQSKPDFPLGVTTETGVFFGPRILADCGSIAVTGISGGGKTCLIQNIVARAHQSLPSVASLVLDLKGDFTNMASLPGRHIYVVRPGDELRLQVMRPPDGVDLAPWLSTLATHFCEYRGLIKSRHVFLDVCLRLCHHFGVDQDPSRPWPSLHNVLDYLKLMRGPRFGKEAEYKASLVNELHGLLNDSGSSFDTADGVDADQHLLAPGGICVLQLYTRPVSVQQFIGSIIIERIVQSRIARNVHNTPLEVLIVLDEAQLILSHAADYRSAQGVAPLANQLLRAREAGVGFIVAPHLLPNISRGVLASAKTFFVVGGLSDSASIDLAVRMLNLPSRAGSMIPRLGLGQALVREIGKEGIYTDAFLVNLDPPDLDKRAIDEPARLRLMRPKLAGLPGAPSSLLRDYPAIMTELGIPREATSSGQPPNSSGPAMTHEHFDLLHDCAVHPSDWMTERRVRLKASDYKVILKTARFLEGQGLLALREQRLGRATCMALEVTDAGWQALGRNKPSGYIGHGGFIHTVCIARLAKSLAAQHWTNVQTEFRVGSHLHPVDVFGCSPQGVATGFEVTLSFSNVVSNALKTFAAPGVVQELIFLCPIMKDCKRAKALVQAEQQLAPHHSCIRICRIDQFIS